ILAAGWCGTTRGLTRSLPP
ncbi:hypothetical protein AZ019_001259, partial [Klebsiella pneumoniae]